MEHPKHNLPESTVGHELRDAAPRPILIFALSLLAALVVIHWVGWKSLVLLQRREDAQNQIDFPTNPLSEAMPVVPPGPRLEPEPSRDVLPLADLTEVKTREQAMIGPSAWGWVDSSHQFARIPLQSAIDLAVQNGLPDVLPATQPSAPPSMPPASALHGPGGVP